MRDSISIINQIEQLTLGKVKCDYILPEDYIHLCRAWLKENQLRHIVTLNPEMVMQAEKFPEFTEAVQGADIRVPDGAGLVWARWFLRSNFWSLWPSLLAFPFVQVERITGVDSVMHLAQLCEAQKESMYLLGGTEIQAQKTARWLRQRFPGLHVSFSSGHVYDEKGPQRILDEINKARPTVLLVAYGSPKQTIWIERHRSDLPSVRIAIGVGGAFAILSEEKPRAPYWMRKINAEWLWRLWLDPARYRRIWQATIEFPLLIERQKEFSTYI